MLETYGKRKFIVYILIKEQKQIKALVIISYYKTANKYSDNAWAVALTEMRLTAADVSVSYKNKTICQQE